MLSGGRVFFMVGVVGDAGVFGDEFDDSLLEVGVEAFPVAFEVLEVFVWGDEAQDGVDFVSEGFGEELDVGDGWLYLPGQPI